MNYANGECFSGTWDCGKYSRGTMKYADGTRYDGSWNARSNVFHGEGTLTYKTGGIRYQGGWKNGICHGRGKFYFPLKYESSNGGANSAAVDITVNLQTAGNNGNFIECQWIDGKKHGHGIRRWQFDFDGGCAGDRFEGYYENDVENGKGTYYYKTGECFVGDYVDGKRHGRGKYINTFGRVIYDGLMSAGHPTLEEVITSTVSLQYSTYSTKICTHTLIHNTHR